MVAGPPSRPDLKLGLDPSRDDLQSKLDEDHGTLFVRTAIRWMADFDEARARAWRCG